MKKTLTQFFVFFITIVLFVGCKKDDDDSSSAMVGKWFQVRETRSISAVNGVKESLTITDFNKTNYMEFRQDQTVETYSERGISVLMYDNTYELKESVFPEPELGNYKYNVSGGYLTITLGSYNVKAKLKDVKENSFTIQVENSFKSGERAFDSTIEAEYQKF